jgi:hypothetical protein
MNQYFNAVMFALLITLSGTSTAQPLNSQESEQVHFLNKITAIGEKMEALTVKLKANDLEREKLLAEFLKLDKEVEELDSIFISNALNQEGDNSNSDIPYKKPGVITLPVEPIEPTLTK